MKKNTINKLIGFGILLFLIGEMIGFIWVKFFLVFVPIGSLMAFVGIYFFFKETDLKKEFTKSKNQEFLTFFFNAIVLKIWTSIFAIWMLTSNLFLFVKVFN